MTYIDRLNVFHQWCESNDLPVNAKLLYFNLLNVFNKAGWPRNLRVDTIRLMLMAGCQKGAAYRARDKLVEAGFITYKKGSKGNPSIYFLSDKRTVSATESATESATVSATVNATQRERPKKKTKKEIFPPESPQEESESFLRFWDAYPRKISRGKAWQTWKKLCPDDELANTIMLAVKEQSGSAQWQQENGRFIPSPDRWLSESRWKDELTPAAANKTYDIDEFEQLASLRLPDEL